MNQLLNEAEARAALDALPGLLWRPFTREELPKLAALYEACERFDANGERTSLADLQEYFDSSRSVPELDTLVGVDAEDALVAIAWSGCNRGVTEQRRVHLGGSVHPTRRGEGIGRAVLAWELAHGSDWDKQSREPGHGPLVMGLLAPTAQTDVRDLAVRHGLPAERFFIEMSQRLSSAIEVSPSAGITVCDWQPERADEVRELLNSAFHGSWGFVDTSPEIWQEQLSSHTFRPAWSVLAVDNTRVDNTSGDTSGDIVGVAFNAAYEQDWAERGYTEGYTDLLAVRATHRGRGIATTLLSASVHRFRKAGLDAAGLGVDSANPYGAGRLYESLGYRQTSNSCVHQLTRAAATPVRRHETRVAFRRALSK